MRLHSLLVALRKGFPCRKALSIFIPPGEDPNFHPESEDVEPEDPTPDPPPNKRTWLIDPGHGPATPGKRSPMMENGGQFLEFIFNQEIAEILGDLCDRSGIDYRYTVNMSSPELGNDLQDRSDFENNLETPFPKALLSIHANAGEVADPFREWSTAHGTETWYYFDILNPNNKPPRQGFIFAGIFQKHLVQALGLRDRGLKYTDPRKINPKTGKPYKQLWILRKTFCPAVLVEIGFYNNRQEVEVLRAPETPEKVARALLAAIQEIENLNILQ